eukprot:4650397-Pleurochrysis_carterae.AAC.1
MEREWHAIGQVCRDQVRNVFFLRETHIGRADRHIHVEEIGNGTFVFDVPTVCERVGEVGVQ